MGGHPPPDAPLRTEDIADIQGGNLVLAQACSQRQGEEDVVVEPRAVLPGDPQ